MILGNFDLNGEKGRNGEVESKWEMTFRMGPDEVGWGRLRSGGIGCHNIGSESVGQSLPNPAVSCTA